MLPSNLTNTYCCEAFKFLSLLLDGSAVLFHLHFLMTDEAEPPSYICW